MFTGLIEDLGEVYRWEVRKRAGRLTFRTALPLKEIRVGSSIAVNGTCLTVVEKSRGRLTVDVSPETLRRTNLNEIGPGDPVNLERPLRLMDRLGGHLVTGHVDGVAVTEGIRKRGEFTFFLFRVSAPIYRLIVPKGSVAVDGISLTVNECKKRCFSVAIIPFTLKNTNLHRRRVGDRVNIETDLIGKYLQQLLKVGKTAEVKSLRRNYRT
ncbi:MAG: riboflavin synthase, partial [Candidatus Binatia bacterium]